MIDKNSPPKSDKTERISYVAFLRGINVGGHNVVKTEQLAKEFSSLEFVDVKIYIQSGNVVFRSDEKNSNTLILRIEEKLEKLLQNKVRIVLRKLIDLEEMVERNPFKKFESKGEVKFYVSFLCETPKKTPILPLFSSNKDVEIFLLENQNVFSLSHKRDRHYGFPNPFVEKELNSCATTRNWSTLKKIVTQ